mmetsp:Transcript_4741/g.13294  ORF Transcript_4741/g.13294 Transcript_4741/m.13294 type:complete len:115 (+) Transcript_4741:244-588(+)|eukprot:CAMPEP_0119127924 /NCGR_PEP_ID=MMETSP1310-20130426/6275_1 /TAXON_ID=464262 /ORGANISM="Genus nov. species nov., Strain RCC2339" /LENGTH=114 /DNA_ID=CAMNT_0007118211 /DNA_START=218 /DNA_END=562 /DNA_ORIENTATION=+
MKILQFTPGSYNFQYSLQCAVFEQEFNENYTGLSVFKEGDKSVTVYVPDEDYAFSAQVVGTTFRGEVERNDEVFKGKVIMQGQLVADNCIQGSIAGKHSEVPEMEVTGTFSLFK